MLISFLLLTEVFVQAVVQQHQLRLVVRTSPHENCNTRSKFSDFIYLEPLLIIHVISYDMYMVF